MNNKQNNPKMNMPKFNMNWIYGMVIVALLLLWFTGGGQKASVRTETSYSEFKKMVLNGYASKIVVNKDNNTLCSARECSRPAPTRASQWSLAR